MKKLQIAIFTISLAAAMSANATLLVDRGLPTAKLNNAAGADRSNVAWVAGDYTSPSAPYTVLGDTFANTSSQTWSINQITLWTVGQTDTAILLGGISGSTLGVVSTATYIGGATYQGSSGSSWLMNQVDFAVNITLAPGQTYQFFLDGTGGEYTIPFLHASNAALSGSPQDGSDNWMLQATVAGGNITSVAAWTSDSNVAGPLNGGWDKASDINVQVYGTVVPEPTTMIAGALLLLPFGASTLRILRKKQTA